MKPICTLLAASTILLTGCANLPFEQTLAHTNRDAAGFTAGNLRLHADNSAAANLLQNPLSQHDAVQLALLNSPALQALLQQQRAVLAQAEQAGKIANPILSLERLRTGDELEFGRRLSFGLLDLLTLPQRARHAEHLATEVQLRLTGEVVDMLTQVRQNWVRAVATRQSLVYAQQVQDSYQAAAQLAQQMQAVGNLSKLARSRQQVAYAEGIANLAQAQLAADNAREELVRILGLSQEQAAQLQLPAQLPHLPATPLSAVAISEQALQTRLDIRLAQAELKRAAQAQGVQLLSSFTDLELSLRHDNRSDAAGRLPSAHGAELAITLPLFDVGSAQRQNLDAQTLALAQRLVATQRAASSLLKTSYANYRSSYDMARHYQDEVLPLRKSILQESVLRYNGMLISVFDLLQEARIQAQAVQAAINAQQQFWLQDAALQAALTGRPDKTAPAMISTSSTEAAASH